MDYIFWIPIMISVLTLIWNLWQQRSIERLKGENERNNLIHRIQFEKEFEIYNDLWANLVDLRNHVSGLRPQLDSFAQNKPEIEINKERLSILNKSFINCVNSFEKNKPFYPKDVYDEISNAIKITKREAFDFQLGDKNSSEYWENSEKNINEIFESTNNVCEIIRKRIGLIRIKE